MLDTGYSIIRIELAVDFKSIENRISIRIFRDSYKHRRWQKAARLIEKETINKNSHQVTKTPRIFYLSAFVSSWHLIEVLYEDLRLCCFTH